MWVVQRCVRDYDDVYCNEVAQFESEDQADQFAEEADLCHPFSDVWHTVAEA